MKALTCICFLALAAVLISSSPAMAGAGIEPPDNATILPDEVWGVVVLICTPLNPSVPDFAVVRVKQIQDCNVVAEVHADPAWAGGCPDLNSPISPEETIKGWSLIGYQFFGISGTPYIDSVKNFKQITDSIAGYTETTFDAKFKFYQP